MQCNSVGRGYNEADGKGSVAIHLIPLNITVPRHTNHSQYVSHKYPWYYLLGEGLQVILELHVYKWVRLLASPYHTIGLVDKVETS